MFKLDLAFDDEIIETLANKIAERSIEIIIDRIDSINQLPHLLTRTEAMNVLRCGETKMAELFARPDFPVNMEFGKKVPTNMLFKWIEKNTRWVEENTNYYEKKAI
jgi:hypothetical protein